MYIYLKNDIEYMDSCWNKNVWFYFCILRKVIINVYVILFIDVKLNKLYYICEINRYGNDMYFLLLFLIL